MLKSELIDAMHRASPHLPRDVLERACAVILNRITKALATGRRVELRDFGSFAPMKRGSRIGRNPKNGHPVEVEPKVFVRFKTGANLQKALNPSSSSNRRKQRQVVK